MRNWEALVEEHLAGLALGPAEKAEVIAEVAAHLEDICEEMRKQGIAEEEAVRRALSQVGDWRDLQRRILNAKRREHFMATRTRQLWVPGFLTLILSMLLLMTLQRLGFTPRLLWGGSSQILFYVPWLVALPFCGALGAYVSSRAGGSRGTAALASVFPVLALTLAFLLMFPIGFAMEVVRGTQGDFSVVAGALLRDGIGWLLMPGAALLAGGLLLHVLYKTRSSSRDAAIG